MPHDPESRRHAAAGERGDCTPDPEHSDPPDADHETVASTRDAVKWIAGYRIIRRLGEGGMGTVYEAEQQRPRRLVALKVIRDGTQAGELHVRLFQREVQSLARLKHPGIATLYESGCTEEGEHYFAMELVRGAMLADHMRNRWSKDWFTTTALGERLAVFCSICEAVNYAHQRGVIHRDLKPSNILVLPERKSTTGGARRVGAAEIKILDFGLAQITDADVAMTTVATDVGRVQGTLRYMSPEQARGNPDEIDLRSDVYSLGVILYELVAGQSPYEISSSGWLEVIRAISVDPPVPPSRIWRPHGRLDSDVETIVLKALEKEPGRRYQSTSALADDVQCHLTNRPILARPPSASYQLRKLIARHRGRFIFASILLVLLTVSAVTMSVMFGWQRREHWRAERERDRALLAVQRAEQAEHLQTERLWESHLALARAGRFSGRHGQRFQGLDALARAAAIRPSLELRNEAIACLALTDLRISERCSGSRPGDGDLCFGFDADLTRFAQGDAHGAIAIQMIRDGREIVRVPGSGDKPRFFRLAPGGKHLAVKYLGVGRDDNFCLWDLASIRPLLRFESPRNDATDFSPDGSLLAVHARDRTIDIYDLRTLEVIGTVESGINPQSLRFAPDGRTFAVTGRNGVEVWSVANPEVQRSFPLPEMGHSVTWRHDGQQLAVGCGDFRVYVWQVERDRLQTVLEGHRSDVVWVLFQPNSSLLVSSAWDATTRLWDSMGGRELVRATGTALQFNREGNHLSSIIDRQLSIWEVAAGLACRSLYGHERIHKRLGNVTFSPDGRLLVSSGRDGVRIWSSLTLQEVAHLPVPDTASALFTHGGDSLLTIGASGIRSWSIEASGTGCNVGAGTVIEFDSGGLDPGEFDSGTFDSGNLDFLSFAAIDANRKTMAIRTDARRLVLYDLLSRRATRVLHREGGDLRYTAISPDGKWVAAGGWVAEGCRVWNAETGETVADLSSPRPAMSVAFSPDGEWLMTGSDAYRLRKVGSWQQSRSFPRSQAGLAGRMAFSPDGTVVAITYTDYIVKLIEVASGRELATLEPPRQELVSWLAFSPDGKQLAAGCESHVIQLWDLGLIRLELSRIGLDWGLSEDGTPQ